MRENFKTDDFTARSYADGNNGQKEKINRKEIIVGVGAELEGWPRVGAGVVPSW